MNNNNMKIALRELAEGFRLIRSATDALRNDPAANQEFYDAWLILHILYRQVLPCEPLIAIAEQLKSRGHSDALFNKKEFPNLKII